MTNHPMGNETSMAIPTSFKKSLDSLYEICPTLAPKTLRMPISLVRFSALKAARPNRPKQAIRMERIVNMIKIVPRRSSA